MIRMLVVSSDTYPPTRVDVSVLFGEVLASRGHRFDWILQSERHCAKSWVADWGGGRVWVGATDLGTSLVSRTRKHLGGIVHDWLLFSRLRSGEYDLIEVKDKFISGILALVAARLFRKPLVYWLSYPFPEDYLHRARDARERYRHLYRVRGWVFWFLLYKCLLPRAAVVFVQSAQMARDVAATGIAPEKLTAVPMGVRLLPDSALATAGVRSVLPAGEPCIVYLGTLAKVRRMDFMVRVLARVLLQFNGVRLYFVGRGNDSSDEQLLRDEAQRLNVMASVVFIGQLPQVEALKYVQEADVCVSPFYPTPILNSTSPTKLVEYLAMGKAVVANDHPEQCQVIAESGGGYCVPYEEQAFADAIVKLLRAPEEARDMGLRGRQYVMKHRSYEVIADLVEQRLAGLLR
jgi:glycosyltransferase involved in cell wall biosynthesis